MNVLALASLALGVTAAAIGVASWRSGGRGLVLAGAAFATLAAMSWTADGPPVLRYTALALLGVTVLACFLPFQRGALREMRWQLILTALTVVLLLLSYKLTDASPQLQTGITTATVVILAALFGVTVVQFVTGMRKAQSSKL